MNKLKMIDLFSGIGGFSLAAKWTNMIETVAFCEIESYAQKVLRKNFPSIEIIDNIRNLKNNGQYGQIDIITGGFPCQPFSIAGKQKGRNDDRDLWPEMFRVIREFRPTWVIGENVANFVNMELERTCTNLEAEGYETQSFIIPACGVDGKHERKRCWILGYSKYARFNAAKNQKSIIKRDARNTSGSEKTSKFERSGEQHALMADTKSIGIQRMWVDRQQKPCTLDTKEIFDSGSNEQRPAKWAIEPAVGRVANGIPARVDRLKCLGNSIVPQVVLPILNAIIQIEK